MGNDKLLHLVLAVLIFSQPSCVKESSLEKHSDKPNIVLFFADDMGYGDLGCYGATEYETPNIDQMAKQGTLFTDFYVTASVCTPSRASLMTGCYPQRVGLGRGINDTSRKGLSSQEITIANYLKQNEYATGIFGKWHLGHYPQFMPLQHGFDEFFGIPYSMDMWPFHPAPKYVYPALPLYENDKIIEYNPRVNQMTTRIIEHAVDFVKRHKNEPFFLYVPYTQPHVPLGVSEKFQGKSKQGMYGDVVMEIDWSVGQVINELKENGLLDNTLVMFASDNGPWLTYGNHGGSSGELREGKGTTFGGGQKVPFLIQMPGTIPAGRVCHEVVTAMDILPTILHITNTSQPRMNPIDGKNAWPVFTGKEDAKSPVEAFFFIRQDEILCVRTGKWKMHLPHKYRTVPEPGKDGMPGIELQEGGEIGVALFDLEKDPGESANLADKHPDIVARLNKLIVDFEEELKNNSRPPGLIE